MKRSRICGLLLAAAALAVVAPSSDARGSSSNAVEPIERPASNSLTSDVQSFNAYGTVTASVGNPSEIIIPVSSMPSTVTDLSVFLRGVDSQAGLAQVQITLIAPDGLVSLDLIHGPCYSANVIPISNHDFQVDDRAPDALPDTATGAASCFQDRNFIKVSDRFTDRGTLASFNGHRANGNWKLRLTYHGASGEFSLLDGFGFILAADEPDTAFTIAPAPGSQTGSQVTFGFGSNIPGTEFECSPNRWASYSICRSPLVLYSLTAGSHTFGVRARPAAGVDPTPAEVAWIVQPETWIRFPWAATLSSTSVGFESPNATDALFACSRDGAAGSDCASPLRLSGLKAGRHTVRVQARISVGGAPVFDSTPDQITFTVLPPDTQITRHPKRRTTRRHAAFVFTSNAAGLGGLTFQCKVDTKPFKACASSATSPFRVKVKPGRHRFKVRARDGAGNIDPTPAVFRWRVRA